MQEVQRPFLVHSEVQLLALFSDQPVLLIRYDVVLSPYLHVLGQLHNAVLLLRGHLLSPHLLHLVVVRTYSSELRRHRHILVVVGSGVALVRARSSGIAYHSSRLVEVFPLSTFVCHCQKLLVQLTILVVAPFLGRGVYHIPRLIRVTPSLPDLILGLSGRVCLRPVDSKILGIHKPFVNHVLL